MEVLNSKGLANRTVPESCVRNRREAHREALTGVRVGQPWSREKYLILGAHAVTRAEGNTVGRATASARSARRGLRPWHARKLVAREPGDLLLGHRAVTGGPHREGEEPKPMMHELEKSDSLIVPRKLANKAGAPAAESMEGSGGIARNVDLQSTVRTPSRVRRVTHADSHT